MTAVDGDGTRAIMATDGAVVASAGAIAINEAKIMAAISHKKSQKDAAERKPDHLHPLTLKAVFVINSASRRLYHGLQGMRLDMAAVIGATTAGTGGIEASTSDIKASAGDGAITAAEKTNLLPQKWIHLVAKVEEVLGRRTLAHRAVCPPPPFYYVLTSSDH